MLNSCSQRRHDLDPHLDISCNCSICAHVLQKYTDTLSKFFRFPLYVLGEVINACCRGWTLAPRCVCMHMHWHSVGLGLHLGWTCPLITQVCQPLLWAGTKLEPSRSLCTPVNMTHSSCTILGGLWLALCQFMHITLSVANLLKWCAN